MSFKLCAMAVCAFVLTGHGAFAQTISKAEDLKPDTPFAGFLKGKKHNEAKAYIALREDQSVGRACKDAYTMGNYAMKIMEPIEMEAGATIPKKGRWLERFQVTRCGRQSLFNAIFTATDKGLEIKPVAPGETAQDLQLVIDLRPLIIRKAKIQNCEARGLLDTAKGPPEGYEPKVADGEYETWTVSGCGKDVDLVLLFTSTADGKVDVQVEKQLPR
ncbi:hypothetical protein [Emcibacter sp. SYSU 3D8]|uniref:hypothetical protein n=1 Tax=Emcibacter sp. SYSU 3D8 TaxID=3133969 RepID=UPI0031FE97C7